MPATRYDRGIWNRLLFTMQITEEILISILICSIPERKEKRGFLLSELADQIDILPIEFGMLEVKIDDSKSFLNGGLSIGEKRTNLVKQATGKYLFFLDDDDTIAPNYIETIMSLCLEDRDVCTFRSFYKLVDYWGLVDMRLDYHVNDQANPNYIIRRPPWHICPVRTEFAQLYDFEDVNNAEDFEWMRKVLTHCTTEAHTDKIIFQYNHGKHSEADKIENYVQPE